MMSYDPLWKLLIDLKIDKTKLRQECKLAKETVTKMAKNEYVGLRTIDKICKTYKCNIEDIVKYIED